VVLDDEAARRLAIALGLPVIGTLGILVLAKQEGIVATVRPLVEALAEVGEVAVGS
jgi:predicted nucleic acid-binding protein